MKKAIVFILLSMGTQQINAANDPRHYRSENYINRNEMNSPTLWGGPSMSTQQALLDYEAQMAIRNHDAQVAQQAIEARKRSIEQQVSALPRTEQLTFLGTLITKLGAQMFPTSGGMDTPPPTSDQNHYTIPKSPSSRVTSPIPVVS